MKPAGVVAGEIDLSRVKGLLFDIDGTLSDTDDRMVDRFSRFLNPFVWLFRDRNPKPFARWVVMAIESPANFIYNLSDRLSLDRVISKVSQSTSGGKKNQKPDHTRFWIIPGSKEMLTALETRFRMAVVSARDTDTTLQFLSHFGLLDFFDVVVTAQSCNHTKPFPDPVLFAVKQLGLSPEQCLMIGDTVVDIAAGKAAGVQTAAVLCGFGTERELTKAQADVILTSTTDLLEILNQE